MQLGNYNECAVEEELPQGFYVKTEDGDRVLLPKTKAPKDLKIGDKITLFIYLDNEARPIATTQKARARVGEFAVLKVKDVNDVGAFLDWGLDKDLILPYSNQLGELLKDDVCVVYVHLDEKSGRITSTEKLRKYFDRDVSELKEGREVSLIAYDFQEEKHIDFLVDKRWTGRLYCDPVSTGLRIGDSCIGYIHSMHEDSRLSTGSSEEGRGERFRRDEMSRSEGGNKNVLSPVSPEGGKNGGRRSGAAEAPQSEGGNKKGGLIILSLSPIGFDALVDKHKEELLKKLKENDGFLPFSDNSSPEEIRKNFGMSKKGFKKLAGTLWKEGIVELSPEGIKLIKPV